MVFASLLTTLACAPSDGQGVPHEDVADGSEPPEDSAAPLRQGPYVALELGSLSACALRDDQTIDCWYPPESAIVTDTPTGTFERLELGGQMACASSTEGGWQCWGNDVNGVLANAPRGWESWLEIGLATYSMCGIDGNGEAQCWSGEMLPEVDPSNVIVGKIAVGFANACALTPEGRIQCWELGRLTELDWAESDEAPALILEDLDGYDTYCAREVGTGNAYCWGLDTWGAVSKFPGGPVVDVSTGVNATCWIALDGTSYCAGWENLDGEVPWEQTAYRTDLGTPIAIESTVFFRCVLTAEGWIDCWQYPSDFGEAW